MILEILMKEVVPEWRKSEDDSVLRDQHEQKEGRFCPGWCGSVD